jgi:signal transduction histidine kinase
MPRLPDFIRQHREHILVAWEAFARELPAAVSMDVAALRDHAGAMLDTIARDLDQAQTEQQRIDKSRGARDAPQDADGNAASLHGLGRAASGFSIESMPAEFRALRASVITLWREEQQHAGPEELEAITRFNEAIDQAIAESVARYMREVETTRDRFLAVLGHDLRTPLGVVLTSSQFLRETADLNDAQRTVVAGMERSGRRMIELVRNLLDLALTRLGSGIPVEPAEMDLGVLVRDVAAEVGASNPGARITVETRGPLGGRWDKERLAQAVTNLVANAVQHGTRDGLIRVAACGDEPGTVTVSVANEGPAIPHDRIAGIFDAMKETGSGEDRQHLGLGLYIVDKIVEAHAGSVDLHSSDKEGTTVVVSLPRDRVAHPSNSGTRS